VAAREAWTVRDEDRGDGEREDGEPEMAGAGHR